MILIKLPTLDVLSGKGGSMIITTWCDLNSRVPSLHSPIKKRFQTCIQLCPNYRGIALASQKFRNESEYVGFYTIIK